MLDQADTATPEVAPVVPAVVAEVPAVAASVEAPVVPAAVPTADELDPETHGDRLVRVKVDGQWEVKSLKDVTAGFSRTSDYTRKMQAVADQRRAAETLNEQLTARQTEFQTQQTELQQLRAFISNPQALQKFLQQTNPNLFQPSNQPVVDPNEIATVQQARDIAAEQAKQFQSHMAKLEQQFNASVAKSAQDIENRRETAVFSASLNSTVKDIFTANPLLTAIPLAEDLLRFQVAKLNPQSLQEAQEAFKTVAEGMMDDLQRKFTDQNKTKLAAAAKLTTARIEPPGGTGIQIQPTPASYDKEKNSMNWKGLHAQAKQMMTD